MSEESLINMRQNIVRVVADYVDIEAEDLIEVIASIVPRAICTYYLKHECGFYCYFCAFLVGWPVEFLGSSRFSLLNGIVVVFF